MFFCSSLVSRIILQTNGLIFFPAKEIAEILSIATGTVRQHIHNIYEKLHVQNRTEAINMMKSHL
jgi:DNA-directed RNA polymerase specialized sigma24 family protein